MNGDRSRHGEEHPGVDLLQSIVSSLQPDRVQYLVEFWLEKEANLILGAAFVSECASTLHEVLCSTESPQAWSKRLAENTACPLNTDGSTDRDSYIRSFCNKNVRWETLCLALVAVGRAAIDIPFFPPLYTSEVDRRAMQRTASSYADRCAEIAVSFDVANDLLLISQYENWILYTMVDGDQSKLKPVHRRINCTNEASQAMIPGVDSGT